MSHFAQESLALLVVDAHHFFQQAEVVTALAGNSAVGGQILGKTRSAIAETRIQKRVPIRESEPMPSLTWSTSAPTDSHSVATALMKLIFIARKAFDAYLMSSALFAVVAIKSRRADYRASATVWHRSLVVAAVSQRLVDLAQPIVARRMCPCQSRCGPDKESR